MVIIFFKLRLFLFLFFFYSFFLKIWPFKTLFLLALVSEVVNELHFILRKKDFIVWVSLGLHFIGLYWDCIQNCKRRLEVVADSGWGVAPDFGWRLTLLILQKDLFSLGVHSSWGYTKKYCSKTSLECLLKNIFDKLNLRSLSRSPYTQLPLSSSCWLPSISTHAGSSLLSC